MENNNIVETDVSIGTYRTTLQEPQYVLQCHTMNRVNSAMVTVQQYAKTVLFLRKQKDYSFCHHSIFNSVDSFPQIISVYIIHNPFTASLPILMQCFISAYIYCYFKNYVYIQ
jgi:hypothetical protein